MALGISLIAFAAVWVLPGFALLWLAARRSSGAGWLGLDSATILAAALALSTAVVAVIGGSLVAFGVFSAAAVAIPLAALGAVGIPAFWAWARRAITPVWRTGALALLVVPMLWSALDGTLQPSHSFQWYYWGLGTDLSAAAGIPSWTLEFGERVRWHPDYVFFSIGSEAYRWLSGSIGDSASIVAWRAPTAGLGVLFAYAVLRLWTSRVAAICGTAAISVTAFFLVKFNAYKPESLGAVVGLAVVLLVARGVRARRPELLLLAGIGLGTDVAIHGIAAAVIGVLAIGVGLIEWRSSRSRGHVIRTRALVAPLIAAAAIVLATGLALQGRAVVAGDAANPRLVGERDPTWMFLQRHEGDFSDVETPSVGRQIVDSVSRPWPSESVRQAGWIAVVGFALAAIVLAARSGSGRLRVGGRSLALWLIALVLAAGFFALNFDTYIPRHTGIARVGVYSYLLMGFTVALGIEFARRALKRRVGPETMRIVAGSAVIFFIAWVIPVGTATLTEARSVDSAGMRAFDELNVRGREAEGGAVLSNASTRGLVEFETGLEAPIEGRQPVIEDPEFLRHANRRLADIQDYFVNAGELAPGRRRLLADLDVRWVLVALDSRLLGSPFSFGSPAGLGQRLRRQDELTPVWSESGISLFEVPAWVQGPTRLGEHRDLWLEWSIALVLVGALILGLAAWSDTLVRGGARASRAG